MTPRAERLRETLAVLDVGHGNSAVLFSGDDVAVFDAGTGSGLLEFLRQQCVDHVKTVFLSHADQDHIGGLVGLLAAETVTVERVVLNTDSSKESATWDDLLYELDARRRAGRTVLDTSITAGDSESFGAVTATAAAPSPYLSAKGPGGRDRSGRKITSNSISAVIRLATDAGPIALLTGDLDLVGLEDLERADGDVTAPILVFPHHGGGTGSADVPGYVTRLIERVHPRVVVFSIGRRREGTPDPEIVRHLRQVAPEARVMCTQLSRFCAKSIPTFTATHLSPTFARGRSDRVCCGGTILVSLHDATEITPESDGHLAFIRNVAESPLCFGGEPPSRAAG